MHSQNMLSEELPATDLAAFASELARQHGVVFERSPRGSSGLPVRHLVSAELTPDATEQLAIALWQARVINTATMVSLLGRHLSETHTNAGDHKRARQAEDSRVEAGDLPGKKAPAFDSSVKQSAPPPHDFRERFTGAGLADCLMVTGAWDELTALLMAQPEICAAILTWFTEPGDIEYPFFVEGHRIAREVLARLARKRHEDPAP